MQDSTIPQEMEREQGGDDSVTKAMGRFANPDSLAEKRGEALLGRYGPARAQKIGQYNCFDQSAMAVATGTKGDEKSVA